MSWLRLTSDSARNHTHTHITEINAPHEQKKRRGQKNEQTTGNDGHNNKKNHRNYIIPFWFEQLVRLIVLRFSSFFSFIFVFCVVVCLYFCCSNALCLLACVCLDKFRTKKIRKWDRFDASSEPSQRLHEPNAHILTARCLMFRVFILPAETGIFGWNRETNEPKCRSTYTWARQKKIEPKLKMKRI